MEEAKKRLCMGDEEMRGRAPLCIWSVASGGDRGRVSSVVGTWEEGASRGIQHCRSGLWRELLRSVNMRLYLRLCTMYASERACECVGETDWRAR